MAGAMRNLEEEIPLGRTRNTRRPTWRHTPVEIYRRFAKILRRRRSDRDRYGYAVGRGASSVEAKTTATTDDLWGLGGDGSGLARRYWSIIFDGEEAGDLSARRWRDDAEPPGTTNDSPSSAPHKNHRL